MSATATINSRAPVQTSAKSIPGMPAARLLPRIPTEDNGTEHPPIHIKLNSSILSLLAESPTPPKITLEVSDKTKSLRIGNYEYQGSLYKEPGFLEVYLPEYSSDKAADGQLRFRNCGQVRNRMAIKQDKPIKIADPTNTVDLSQPTEQRIVQLLMLGPTAVQDLAAKAQASRELVDAVLAQIAEPRVAGSPLFILRKEFQHKLAEKSDSDISDAADSKRRDPDESQPKPERITKTLKELREARAAAKSPRESPAASRTSSETEGRKANSVPPDPSGRDENVKLALKRSAPAPLSKGKRARSEVPEGLPMRPAIPKASEPDEDMFEIARKFKSAYGEYLELYAVLSKRKARSPSQVEKLLTMHRQLERWKNTLWTNARNKRMVN